MIQNPAVNAEFLKNLDRALREQRKGRSAPAAKPQVYEQAIFRAFVGSPARPPSPAARKAA